LLSLNFGEDTAQDPALSFDAHHGRLGRLFGEFDDGRLIRTRRKHWSLDGHDGDASVDAAETWFEENDPEGVAFEYDVLE
jgi:hypothetical protein